ncbi:insulinase family protein [Marinimicrobium alkaliphilum]|uniref:insulinase family protein n=1 Tax=Marinimicrobium alkaliphilum TaxID=2202654 RepID=UPI000DB9DCEB|nr:insulinase family protein [Marinimicrobium alkaliphilum]
MHRVNNVLRKCLWVIVALMMSACAHQSTAPVSVVTSEQDPRSYRYLTLPNGVSVMLIQASEAEAAAVSLALPVGFYQDPPEYQGLAHYLEHMLFLGTENYPEPNALQNYLSDNGGFSNAYVSTDHTNYFFQIPHAQIDGALDRFSDYFKAPLFDRTYSEKELTAIHNEWSMGRNQDGRIRFQLAGLTANPEHPATQLGVGNRETLPSGDDSGLHQALLDFYERYYGPSQMVLTFASQIDLDEQEALVRAHFEAIPARDSERPSIDVPGLTSAQEGQHIRYRPQTEQRELVLEFGIDNNADQWRLKANQYLSNILSAEEPGTLAYYLRDQGWANGVGVSIQPDYYGKDGFARIHIDATREGMAERDQVIAAALAYIAQVRRDGIRAAYYEEYRVLAERRFAEQQPPNPLQHAVHTSVRLLNYPPQYINAVDAIFDDFDPGAIQAVADQLRPERLRLWHISGDEPVDTDIPHHAGQYATAAITDEELAHWQALGETLALELPPANPFAATGEGETVSHDLQEFTQLINEPGLDVWFRHATAHQNGHGYLHFVWNSDLGVTDARHFVLGAMVNGLLNSRNAGLMDRARRAGIHVSFDRSNSNMQNLTVRGPAERHPELVSELLDSVGSLSFSDSELAREIDNFERWLRSEPQDAPGQQAIRWLNREVQAFDWDREAFLRESASVSADEVRQYHRTLMEVSTLRVYGFGHYLPEQVKAMARHGEQALGSARTPGAIHVTESIDLEAGDRRAIARDVEHADVAWVRAFVPGVERDERVPAHAALMLLGRLIHQPFFTELRTEEQWGYWVQAGTTWLADYPAFVTIVQSSERNLSAIQARVTEFLENYDEALQALEPAVFEQLRANIVSDYRQRPNDFTTEATRARHDFYRNDGNFNTHAETADAIEATTLEDVQQALRHWVLGDGSAVITAQAKGSAFSEDDFAP